MHQVLAGLVTLSDAGNDIADLVDIGQAGIDRGNGMGGVILIVPMRIETVHVETRPKSEGAAFVRILRGGFALRRHCTHRRASKGGTTGCEKGTPTESRRF